MLAPHLVAVAVADSTNMSVPSRKSAREEPQSFVALRSGSAHSGKPEQPGRGRARGPLTRPSGRGPHSLIAGERALPAVGQSCPLG